LIGSSFLLHQYATNSPQTVIGEQNIELSCAAESALHLTDD
jgi:hypothetical protein